MSNLSHLSFDSGYVAGEARLSTSGRSGQSLPPSGTPRRGSWWQYTGSPFSRNGSWDTVSSLPEDAVADTLSRCPCLPELEDFPWTDWELRGVVRKVPGADGFTPEALRSLSALLRRALVRVCREAQRLSELHRRCTRLEVQSAVRVVLSWGLADKCVSSAVRVVSLLWMTPGDIRTLWAGALRGSLLQVDGGDARGGARARVRSGLPRGLCGDFGGRSGSTGAAPGQVDRGAGRWGHLLPGERGAAGGNPEHRPGAVGAAAAL